MPDLSTRSSFSETIILIPGYGMGSGDVELTVRLLRNFLTLLQENRSLPAAICFYTEGIKLVVDGSPLLEQLHEIEQKGVRLIVCSTCLQHYGITEQMKVGIVGGMGDILEAQQRAGKVITL